MAKQEAIDGAGVAAAILSRFPLEEQERLVTSIRGESPKVAAVLERRLVDFNRVYHLENPALQNLLHDIPHRDIAISLKTAAEPVKQRILENVSETKLQLVEESIETLPPMKVPDIEAAQNRILRRLEELYPEAADAGQRKPLKPRLA